MSSVYDNFYKNGMGNVAVTVLEDWADPDADLADMIVDGGVAYAKGAASGMAIKAAGTALATTEAGSAILGAGTAIAGSAMAATSAATAAAAGMAAVAAPVVAIGVVGGLLFGLFD